MIHFVLTKSSTGGLSPPSGNLHLAHVAVGRGTQNYTCDTTNSSAIPKAIGAKATLFNVTCLTTSPQNLVASIPGLALKAAIPSTSITVQTALAQLTSGHHYFTNMTTPFFDLETDVPHNYGTVSAAKLAAVPAPKDAPVGADGAAAVPWLKLAGWAGNYKEVYRIYTAGGSAPANCSGQTAAFEVEYSAVYYFYAANSS